MSDKYGDIARSLGCEVTEEAESLRIALVKESARVTEAEKDIERLRAELKLRNETVDQLIKGCDDGAKEVERCHTLIDALCEKIERAEKAKGGMDD